MFTFLKYIDYAMKAKQGYEEPDGFLAETAFAPIEGFFILSFIILGVLSGGSLFVGFFYQFLFFRVIGIIFLMILVGDIFLFITVKRIINRFSKKVVNKVKQRIHYNKTIDVDVNDV